MPRMVVHAFEVVWVQPIQLGALVVPNRQLINHRHLVDQILKLIQRFLSELCLPDSQFDLLKHFLSLDALKQSLKALVRDFDAVIENQRDNFQLALLSVHIQNRLAKSVVCIGVVQEDLQHLQLLTRLGMVHILFKNFEI